MGVFLLSGIRALVEIYRFNQRKKRSGSRKLKTGEELGSANLVWGGYESADFFC